jgi:hypothetical protein
MIAGSNCVPAPTTQLVERDLLAHAKSVWPRTDHCVEGVTDGHDAGAEWDLVGRLAFGIALEGRTARAE